MKRNLLYVDDERANLVVFRAAFKKHFNILEASSAHEALDLLRSNDVPLMVADQRMPDVTGVELCETVKRDYPHTIRMLLTGYTDSDAMMEAINKGQVYSFITKPWERETLFPTLIRGFEAYDLAVSNSALIERLDHAERCASLGRCVAGIAHEMRNQLFILPLVELIESNYSDQKELAELGHFARETHNRLAELIDEVKSFVRMEVENTERTPNNLATLTREAVSLAGMHESIPKRILKLTVSDEPVIPCHKSKIQQVIFNLVKNAADAVESHQNPEIEIVVDRQDNQARLSVHDNGAGIDPDTLKRIWEPFFTTKGENGTGLGLDMSRRIVESHGGSLDCDTGPDRGTTFFVRLPLVEDAQAP